MDNNKIFDGNLRYQCEHLAKEAIDKLKKSGKKIACAESCTGGMLCELITSVSGASEVFEFGAVTYSERIKSHQLGIPPQLIDECGVVSREVALAMAYGAMLSATSDIGIGITGIAGPNGGTNEQPVGTVWVSVANKDRDITLDIKAYDKGLTSRSEIREYACLKALEGLLEII